MCLIIRNYNRISDKKTKRSSGIEINLILVLILVKLYFKGEIYNRFGLGMNKLLIFFRFGKPIERETFT
jgi:hypothetical protein